MASCPSQKRRRVVLTLEQRLIILERLKKGTTQEELAGEYGVGRSTIGDIKKSEEKLKSFSSKMQSLAMNSMQCWYASHIWQFHLSSNALVLSVTDNWGSTVLRLHCNGYCSLLTSVSTFLCTLNTTSLLMISSCLKSTTYHSYLLFKLLKIHFYNVSFTTAIMCCSFYNQLSSWHFNSSTVLSITCHGH